VRHKITLKSLSQYRLDKKNEIFLLNFAASDTGLGEMGRFGYRITNELGPWVRIFAVTTDLPLVANNPVDIGVEDFCGYCKKSLL
jgi:epoxyqueuosine reductase QueG